MAHVTTPRWLSPVSRRIVVIAIAAAAAMMLLTSILVTSASAADPERVRNVKVPACQELGFGVDTFKETVPRGDADPNYDEVVPLSNRSDVNLPGSIRLTAPPNRSFVTFTLDEAAVEAGVIVLGAVLFNRTDQKDGNLYDYRLEGGVTSGTLEPPPRDQGNEKQVVFCFDSKASLSITATLNGVDVPVGVGDPTPVVTNPLTWVFTVENTGGLPLTGVTVTEGTMTICSIGILAPADERSCSPDDETGVIDGSVVTSRTFAATGEAGGEDVTASTGPISYLVGLACLASTTTGGPGLEDDPYAAFWAGPSKLSDPCPAVAISLSAEVIGDDQIVSVEPADGFAWNGATGLVTIEWDAVSATDSAVPRTMQELNGVRTVVPWCNEVVSIALVTDPGTDPVTDPWFYKLNPESATYPDATSGGDICLVLQSTTPVPPGTPELLGRVQTTEVFYIWDDPQLIRPK